MALADLLVDAHPTYGRTHSRMNSTMEIGTLICEERSNLRFNLTI